MPCFGVTCGGVGAALVGPAFGNDPEMGGGSGLFIEALLVGGAIGRCGAGSFAPGSGGI